MEYEKLQEIIAMQLSMEPASVTEDKSFKGDLDADSLDLMEIIMALEDELGIEIPDDELDAIVTVGDAYRAISRADGE